jgi:hypothetical protein
MLFEFSDTGVEKTLAHSHTRLEWKAFSKYMEVGEHFILIYPNGMADFIPKHAFASQHDCDSVRGLLEAKMTKYNEGPHPIFGKTRIIFYLVLVIGIVALVLVARHYRPR